MYIQIDVVQLGCRKASLEGTLGAFVVFQKAHRDLAGVEDLGPVDAGLANGLCAFRLVFVVLCAVDLDTENHAALGTVTLAETNGKRRTWRYPTSKALRVVFSVTSGGLQHGSCQSISQQHMYCYTREETHVW